MSDTRIILYPEQLMLRAKKASEEMEEVALSPEQVKDIAEFWFKDQEKIKYLESLLLRRN